MVIDYIIVFLCAAALALSIAVLIRMRLQSETVRRLVEEQKRNREAMGERNEALRRELNGSIRLLSELISQNQRTFSDETGKKFSDLQMSIVNQQLTMQRSVAESLRSQEQRLNTFAVENEQRLDNIRSTVSKHFIGMQEDNNRRLEEMRKTVDERLQKTLEDRMTRSFAMVNERLEQVYKGLGEMQTLASGVGDLKKVLSNVKTRGILGEIQLGSILDEVLAPEQFERDVQIKQGTRVEFALRLPGENDSAVYLPVDSKFPMDSYERLMDAYDSAIPERIKSAQLELRRSLKVMANDIEKKYILPPLTTGFAIMFLPTEGLYAEAVRLGMIEELQRDNKVNIAGPSTMAALLNSLQTGYRSYIIHKRSGEVWDVLNEVKTEFDTFAEGLQAAQNRIEQANTELDRLVGVRTRQMQKKLRKVESIEAGQ